MWFRIALLLCTVATVYGSDNKDLEDEIKVMQKKIDLFKKEMTVLANQMMLQQFYAENRARSDGSSGLKQIRTRTIGPENYFSETHTGKQMADMHEHPDYMDTVGLGEFSAVMNGIEFQTRHNDYKMVMPSKTSTEYGKTEPVPFPDVPPSVLSKGTVDEQIAEMGEYFKAFATEDEKHRDYTKYFKPVLCYLEGAYTISGDQVEESFESERNYIAATTWKELQDKFRYQSYSGLQDNTENTPMLPTTIMGFKKNGNESDPIYAQWNYRILCHPLKKFVPQSRIKIADDLSVRERFQRSVAENKFSRSARFKVNTADSRRDQDQPRRNTFLDALMEQIPGKDNYKGNLTDWGCGARKNELVHSQSNGKLNAAFYHRWYKMAGKDAFGLLTAINGFSDDNLFVALTSQEKVASVKSHHCQRKHGVKYCRDMENRYTYALPLEIIYLTPLHKWNPYNLPHHDDKVAVSDDGETGMRPAKALKGTSSKQYFRTPDAFFSSEEQSDPESDDTGHGARFVLDGSGTPRKVRGSGIRILLPKIVNVGHVRTRYPVIPVYGEGGAVWKELNALKDYVLDPDKYKFLKWDKEGRVEGEELELETSPSSGGYHIHLIHVSDFEYEELKAGKTVKVQTTEDSNHQHDMQIRWSQDEGFYYESCDGLRKCPDGHRRSLTINSEMTSSQARDSKM